VVMISVSSFSHAITPGRKYFSHNRYFFLTENMLW